MVTVWIDPAILGRPLGDVATVYRHALWLAGDDWQRCPDDELRWIGIGDESASATMFAIWDMLAFALGRSQRSPVEKVLRPPGRPKLPRVAIGPIDQAKRLS